MNYFIEGFLLQAGLILGLGAQNLFVLDMGMRRQHHLLIATICIVCDVLLIALGVLGAAAIFLAIPILKKVFGVLGVGFLAFYALLKLKEAIFFSPQKIHSAHKVFSRKKAIMAALAFTLLNPHVYLDTVILIGGYATKHREISARAFFGAGAGFFSLLWFYGLVILSAMLAPLLKSERAMRILSLMAGIVLGVLSYKLGGEVYSWLSD